MPKITPKTPAELQKMRESGKILREVLEILKSRATPGTSLSELDAIAEKSIRDHDATPAFKGFHGFPSTICAMLNSEVVHGIPNNRILTPGDLLSVDCGAIFDGFCSDAAFSLVVGGDAEHPRRAEFSKVVRNALSAGCEVAVAGNFTGDIGAAIQKVVEKAGFSIIREYGGHGIGREMHEGFFLPNFGKKGEGVRLEAGMTFAIEPIVASGSAKTRVLDDGWTVVTVDKQDAIQWECFGAVGEGRFEVFA